MNTSPSRRGVPRLLCLALLFGCFSAQRAHATVELYYVGSDCIGPPHVYSRAANGISTIVYTATSAGDEILGVAGDSQGNWYGAVSFGIGGSALLKNGVPVATPACRVDDVDVAANGVLYYTGEDCAGRKHVYRRNPTNGSSVLYTPPSATDEILGVAGDGQGNWYASIGFGGSGPLLLRNGVAIATSACRVGSIDVAADGTVYYAGEDCAGGKHVYRRSTAGAVTIAYTTLSHLDEILGVAGNGQDAWYACIGNGPSGNMLLKNGAQLVTPACSVSSADIDYEVSGGHWVGLFPGSHSVSALTEPFRSNVMNFLAALNAAGAHVVSIATYRPAQRAYLMHYAWRIDREGLDPLAVPSYNGSDPTINVRWDHHDAAGAYDMFASKAAAKAMVNNYAIVFKPAYPTLHSLGEAIDMSVKWTGHLSIYENGDSTPTIIASTPRTGTNPQLHAVGATYGVIKLPTDRPHWSLHGN